MSVMALSFDAGTYSQRLSKPIAVEQARWPDESASLTADIETALQQLHRIGVLMPHRPDVRSCLWREPSMVDVVLEVAEAAAHMVGAGEELSLEVFRDPEAVDRKLTLYLRQQQYDADIMERIKKIRSSLYPRFAGSDAWVLLTTDFQPPRATR